MQVTVYRSDAVEQKLCRSEEYDMLFIDTDVSFNIPRMTISLAHIRINK